MRSLAPLQAIKSSLCCCRRFHAPSRRVAQSLGYITIVFSLFFWLGVFFNVARTTFATALGHGIISTAIAVDIIVIIVGAPPPRACSA